MSQLPNSVVETGTAQPAKQDRGLLDVTVLVVDDLEDNLDLIEDMLEDDVWSVLRAESGEDAIRLALERPPDVFLVDLMMPNMNGFALLRALRSNEALMDTPVILQTAHADKENIISARRLGFASYLCKPVTKSRLLAEMSSCLESRPRGGAGSYENTDDLAMSKRMRELTMTLADAKTLLETGRPSTDVEQSGPVDAFRDLIPDQSAIGERLIRLANSPVYGGRYPARTVAEAVVRIGVRETNSLIRKASSTATQEISKGNVLKALDLLEVLAALFPDRTSTPDGTLSLVRELNAVAQSTYSDETTADGAGPNGGGDGR